MKRCDSKAAGKKAAGKKAARRKGAVSLSRNPSTPILSAFVAGHLMGGLGLMSTSAARRSFTITINSAGVAAARQSSRLALSVSSNDQCRLTKLKEAQFLHFKRGRTGDKRGDNNVDIPDMYPLVLLPGEDAAWLQRSCF